MWAVWGWASTPRTIARGIGNALFKRLENPAVPIDRTATSRKLFFMPGRAHFGEAVARLHHLYLPPASAGR
jgi:hypothetical protein